MYGIDSILCVVDPAVASGGAAVEKAATLARAFNAALELLICSVPPVAADQDAALSSQLEALADPLRARCPTVSMRLIIGESLHRSLLEYIGNTNVDLVVKDTHPHAFAQRVFGTNCDWQLVRACAPPLLLTHASPWNVRPVIMACVDPTHPQDPGAVLDHCILQGAQALSRRLGGVLHVPHADQRRQAATIAAGESQCATRELPTHESIVRLARIGALAEEFDVAPKRVHVKAARVRKALACARAEQQADILVMGALSRANPLAAVLGHEVNYVLEHLRCDVLVVKVPGAAH